MDHGVSICRAVLLFGLCFLILQPLLNKISVSFMTEGDLYDPIVISIPMHFTTENYRLAAGLMEFGKSLLNSLAIALTISVVQVSMCTLVGYGFARFQFPLKRFWFACVMVMILIPPQVISTSLHLHFKYFDVFGISKLLTGSPINLRGSVIPYYMMSFGCMGLKNGLYIYMIRQFFRNIPKEMEEAAYVDGCGTLKTFVSIMLPDAKPILTSCFLFSFVWHFNDYYLSKQLLGTNKRTLIVALSSLRVDLAAVIGGQTTTDPIRIQTRIQAGCLLTILPMFLLYIVTQRKLADSIEHIGIK